MYFYLFIVVLIYLLVFLMLFTHLPDQTNFYCNSLQYIKLKLKQITCNNVMCQTGKTLCDVIFPNIIYFNAYTS